MEFKSLQFLMETLCAVEQQLIVEREILNKQQAKVTELERKRVLLKLIISQVDQRLD